MEDFKPFIDECQKKYEHLMEDSFNNAISLSQLQDADTLARATVYKEMDQMWMKKCVDPIPADLFQSVTDAMQKTFKQLMDTFLILSDHKLYSSNDPKNLSISTLNLDQTEDIAIGIDLGTTMCCIMVLKNGKVQLIPNKAQGNSATTPSYVAFMKDGTDTFGTVAKERSYRYPEVTIYDAKRMIGRTWDDENLKRDKANWPFEIVNENDNPKIKTWNRTRYPHEISARLLARFRVMAEEHLGLPRGTISKAVITVPAYFTEPQRAATKEAALCAGLDVLNILSEPSAAAIAYNYERWASGKRKALVYDFGGGTFDVAIALVETHNVEILGVDGDTHLGGQDIDQLIVDYCINEFEEKEKINLRDGKESEEKSIRDKYKRAISRLKLQCEKAKEELSSSDSTLVEVLGIHGDKNLEVEITREIFNALAMPIVEKTLKIVKRAIRDVKTKGIGSLNETDDVIMVGGSTRIPLVMQKVKDFFKGKQLCQNIDPDRAVAYGAAVQAAILNKQKGIRSCVKVSDVLPMSLGVEVIGKRFSIVIPKNTRIPCEFQGNYYTASDMQTTIRITVYQGEHFRSSDNNWLGEFLLKGIPPKKQGEEKAIVKMTIDFMGILTVSATSVSTGKRNEIAISADKLGMDKDTIEMLKEQLRPRPPALPEDKEDVKPRKELPPRRPALPEA